MWNKDVTFFDPDPQKIRLENRKSRLGIAKIQTMSSPGGHKAAVTELVRILETNSSKYWRNNSTWLDFQLINCRPLKDRREGQMPTNN